MGIVNKAHNAAGAQRYVDWALTPKAQQIGHTLLKYYQIPTNPDAVRSDKLPANVKLVNYNIVVANSNTARLLDRALGGGEAVAPGS